MALKDYLIVLASDCALSAKERAAQLDRELTELEIRKGVLETQFKSAVAAANRISNYRPRLGLDYQCPNCWVEKGMMSPMQVMPSGAVADRFRCRLCGNEFQEGMASQ